MSFELLRAPSHARRTWYRRGVRNCCTPGCHSGSAPGQIVSFVSCLNELHHIVLVLKSKFLPMSSSFLQLIAYRFARLSPLRKELGPGTMLAAMNGQTLCAQSTAPSGWFFQTVFQHFVFPDHRPVHSKLHGHHHPKNQLCLERARKRDFLLPRTEAKCRHRTGVDLSSIVQLIMQIDRVGHATHEFEKRGR